MINETKELKCVDLFKDKLVGANGLAVTATTIGKKHYLLIGSNHCKYILFEEIPAPLPNMGNLTEEDLSKLRLNHVADEGVAGCRIVTADDGEEPIKVPAKEDWKELAVKAATGRLKQVLTGKVIPFDATDDVKPFVGLNADEEIHIIYDSAITVHHESLDGPYQLGSGTKFCKFPLKATDLRTAGRKGVEKFVISIGTLGLPLMGWLCDGFGMFKVASGLESLAPQTPKEAIDAMKQVFADNEEMLKAQSTALKATASSIDAAMRESKKALNEELKSLQKVFSETGDPKKVKQLEDKLGKKEEECAKLKEEVKTLKAELKAFESIRKAMANIPAAPAAE